MNVGNKYVIFLLEGDPSIALCRVSEVESSNVTSKLFIKTVTSAQPKYFNDFKLNKFVVYRNKMLYQVALAEGNLKLAKEISCYLSPQEAAIQFDEQFPLG